MTGNSNPLQGGTASIFNPAGQILFYTDGQTIYNRSHSVMKNGSGLNGNLESIQSSLTLPTPGSDSLFYVFTSDCLA